MDKEKKIKWSKEVILILKVTKERERESYFVESID